MLRDWGLVFRVRVRRVVVVGMFARNCVARVREYLGGRWFRRVTVPG